MVTSQVRPVRLVVVDPDPAVRDSIQAMAHTTRDLQIVAIATSGEELIRLLDHVTPDVVVLGTRLPGMSAFAATRELGQRSGGPAIILLATSPDEEEHGRAAGAVRVIPKDASRQALLAAIRAVVSPPL
ncbi:MAG: hypothetical protein KatS3mg060_1751 [Dehalococcoidia bacterium]|nr:MAG: hypothetical protein KatS3mg060_1751 [Dehalococcoidia bacterium]